MTSTSNPVPLHQFPADFTPERKEELFREIVRMYDLADNILESIQGAGITNREVQMELATPFITQITNSANILSAFYVEVVQKGKPLTPDIRDTMESAFRNVFIALKEVVTGMEQKLLPKGDIA